MSKQEKRFDLSQGPQDFTAHLDRETEEITANEIARQKRVEDTAQAAGQTALDGFTVNDYYKHYLGSLVSTPRQRSSIRR